MAIKSNPQKWVAAWRAGVGASGAKYTEGVQNSADWAGAATAPAAVAARGTNWNAANQSGKIDRGIANIGTAGWRATTVAKAGNWATGVNTQQAQANAAAGATKLFGFLAQAEQAISGLPRGDYGQNRNRLLAWVDAMHQAKVNAG